MKKLRSLAATAIVCIAVPGAATAAQMRTDAGAANPRLAKHAGARRAVPRQTPKRVLCICNPNPTVPTTAPSEAELEAQYDAELIAHGLDPVYNVSTTREGA